jgi:predicted ATPase
LITRVEATNFRCLKSVSQALRPFQVLVGPNSSGKSAFLDVISFIGDLVSVGLKGALAERTENFYDLVWGREGASFTLGVEAQMPPHDERSGIAQLRHMLGPTVRYEVRVGLDTSVNTVKILSEHVVAQDGAGNTRTIMQRGLAAAAFTEHTTNDQHFFAVMADRSGLWNLPDDRTEFHEGAWFRELLQERTQLVDLDKTSLRAATPPGRGKPRIYDGRDLAQTAITVSESWPDGLTGWIKHIQTALPDVEMIKTVLRPDDRHRYLMVRYRNGIEVPSWALSDGTLRLLALTLLAYIANFDGVYLIEEPEIGVHPTAIETIVQSLSSVYYGQVLLTSHSPILLSLPEPRDLLCFQRTDQGTEIIPGDRHPLLQDWRSGVSISDLFAAGVLG